MNVLRLMMIGGCGVLLGVVALPASSGEIDLGRVSPGAIAPIYTEGTLEFKATKNTASCAAAPGRYDLSGGLRIDLEYRLDGIQAVPYSRILVVGPLSIQIHDEVGEQIKIFFQPKQGNYAQAMAETAAKYGEWRRLTAIFDPTNRMLFIQIDDEKPVTARIGYFNDVLNDLELLLGAERRAGSGRGFTGKVRNLRITAPCQLDKKFIDAQAVPVPVINGERVVFRRVAANPGRHYAFPGLLRLADGRLAAVFREGDGHVCPYGRLMIAWSNDLGDNWSVPRVVFDSPNDDRDPALLQSADGTLILSGFRHGQWLSMPAYSAAAAYARAGFDGDLSVMENFIMFSRDGGKSWSEPQVIPAFTPHGPVVHNDKLLIPYSETVDGRRQVNIYQGDPSSGSWEKIGCAGDIPAGGADSFDEANLLVLDNGEILCAIRNHNDGFMRLSRSSDGGKSWSGPEKTPVRGFPQHLLELSDGRILATYGYRYPPMGIRGCISRDGGKSWDIDKELIIRADADSSDIGYPVSIELDDGRVMTIYYFSSPDNWKTFIETATYRP